MTTKTQAAKAFAEKYGSYSPTSQAYLLISSLTAKPLDYYEYAMLKDQAQEQRARADQAIADLQAVMRVLGVTEQYKDDVEAYYERSGYYSDLVTPRTRVTKTALTKFREDIRAVDKATDAAAALTRLAGGAK